MPAVIISPSQKRARSRSESRFPSPTSATSTPGCCRARPLTLDRHRPLRRRGPGRAGGSASRSRRRAASKTSSWCSSRTITSTTAASRTRSSSRSGARDRSPTSAPLAYGSQLRGARARPTAVFSLALMHHHGVPAAVIADTEAFWEMLRRKVGRLRGRRRVGPTAESIRAGGRDLRVVARPGHSTTDALLVDERERIAFVGDHLPGQRSPPTPRSTRRSSRRGRARVRGSSTSKNLRRTAAMPLERLLTGHGEDITDHAELVLRRLAEHERRCDRILATLARRPQPPRTRSPTDLWPEQDRLRAGPCSSSGRCSGTSTCCWTPDASTST